jgi:hypothetical protein
MKHLKVVILISFVVVALTLVSGCSTPSSDPSIAQNRIDVNMIPSITNLGTNLYFVQCNGYDDCSMELKTFSENHNITSIAGLDSLSYGKTGGYFIITG